MALMIECPMGKPLEGCPAYNVRGLPLEEIVKLALDMEEKDLDRIIEEHQECLHNREMNSESKG